MSTRNKHEAVIRRVIEEVFNGAKHELIGELYTSDCLFKDTTSRDEFRGLDMLKGMLEVYSAAFPDAHYEIQRVLVEGNCVAVHWRASGTHTGHFWGQPPTGATFDFPAMAFMEVTNGRISCVEQVWDMHLMCAQLSLKPPPFAAPRASAQATKG